jgi:hypothetical protein
VSSPEEEYFTYDEDSDSLIRHETLEGAEDFAGEVESYIQFTDTERLDEGGFNTFRDE